MNWELIGKLGGGGADVQKIPVEAVTDGSSRSEVIMHTVHVPEGETWLVVLSGDLTAFYTTSNGPQLFIGEESIGPNLPEGRIAITAEVTGTAEIILKRNHGLGTDRFVGYLYTIPFDLTIEVHEVSLSKVLGEPAFHSLITLSPPPGEVWHVEIEGTISGNVNHSVNQPRLRVGGSWSGKKAPGRVSHSGTITSSSRQVGLETNSDLEMAAVSFTGTVTVTYP